MSFSQKYRKSICRFEYNIDRIAAKYIKAASISNAVIRLRTMTMEFEDNSKDHAMEEHENMARMAKNMLNGHLFGNAHISTPSLSGLNTEDVGICRRINRDFERKYAGNAFSDVPLRNITNFLPLTSIRRKRKIEKDANGETRRIELTEQHRIIDYGLDRVGGFVRRLTKLDRKFVIKRESTPERPLTGSSRMFYRMIIDSDLESIRSKAIDLSFFKPTICMTRPQRLTGSRRLALTSIDDKMKGMLALPNTSKTIKKDIPIGNIRMLAIDNYRTNRSRDQFTANKDQTNWDMRFIRWLKETELRTRNKNFDCDPFAENFEKVCRRGYSNARRMNELQRRGCRL